jgi:hypothetical protein
MVLIAIALAVEQVVHGSRAGVIERRFSVLLAPDAGRASAR